jgi:predicted TIM-barrel fold metal-dependent hydrolase
VNPPPDLWQREAPAKLKDRVPRVESTPDGDMWVTDGKSSVIPGLSFMAGREHRDYQIRIHYKEMRPGSWDPQARLADMDQDGIFIDVLYGGGPARFDEPELRAFCTQRYNDWLFELERASGRRLLPVPILPINGGIDEARAELARVAKKGARAVQVDAFPDNVGAPHYSDAAWEPFWSDLEETGIPLSFHIQGPRGMQLQRLYDPTPGVREAFISLAPMGISELIAELIFCGICERHPGFHFVVVETGIGWIPYFLERMDGTFKKHRFWTKSIIGAAEHVLVPPGTRDVHRGPPRREAAPRRRAREHPLVERLPPQRLDVAALARGRGGALRRRPGPRARSDRLRERGAASTRSTRAGGASPRAPAREQPRLGGGAAPPDPEFFRRLCELQAPDYVWIGCADSRVPANEIVGLAPGELFVHRNVANVVAPGDPNCTAVLQYAIEVLRVGHVIVCGHYGCGGVQAALGAVLHGPIERWIAPVRTVYGAHAGELDAIADLAARAGGSRAERRRAGGIGHARPRRTRGLAAGDSRSRSTADLRPQRRPAPRPRRHGRGAARLAAV